MADRTVSVALKAKVDGFVAGIRTAGVSVKDFSGKLNELGTKHRQDFNDLTTAAGGLGLAMAGAFGLVVKSAMGFDKEMSAVAAASDTSGKSLEQLRQSAIRAGQATIYSASQAAQAEEELAKAGVSTADILGGGLTGALSLAAAGGIDLADAATDAAKAMNVFALQGRDVGHIADVLAAGANKSATDVSHLSQALSQGGQVAAQTGLSLEDTVGTLSALAQAGLDGSDAGTSLKTMLQALANPSKQTADLMRQLGINAYDATGQFIGITALAQQLQDKLKGLTQAQRDQAMAQIFGSDAVRSATVLYRLGAQGLQQYITAVDQVGAAQDTAAKRMDNLSGDVEQLRGSLETLFITSGEGASGGLRQLTQAADRMVSQFAALPSSIQSSVTLVSGLGGAGLVGAVGMLKLRQKVGEVKQALEEMGPVGTRAASMLGKVTSVAGKLTVAFAALQAISAALGSDVDPSIAATTKALDQLAKGGQKTGAALQHLDYDLGTLGSGGWAKFGNGVAGTVEGLTGLGGVMDESLMHAKERLSAIDAALAAMASGGHADEAAADFQALAAEAKKVGISLEDLKAGLPQYEAILSGATATQRKNIQVTADEKSKTDALAASVQDAIDKYGSFKSMIDGLNGAHENSVKATLDAKQAIDDLKKSLKENHGALSDNTQAGRDDMRAVLQVADAARDAAEAKYEETGDVKAATDTYNSYKAQLIQTLMQAGETRKAAEKLANQLMQIPKNISTDINSNASAEAARIQGVLNKLGRIDGSVWTYKVIGNYIQTGSGRIPLNREGGVYEHAAVGVLRDAQMFSPVASGARYGYAEPGTGGEAFVPKFGDYARSTAILDRAASWYGGRFVPGGGSGTLRMEVSGGRTGSLEQAMASWIMFAVRTGQIQFWAGNQRVGVVSQ